MFSETARQVLKDSYMDQRRLTASNKHKLKNRMQEDDKILGHVGIMIKG